jgi:phosphatidylglycerophosphate synthase
MGLFKPFIGGVKTHEEFREADHSNDKLFTPADAVSLARPMLGAKASAMLIRGDRYVTPLVALLEATDAADGLVARLIEKQWPESGWGVTAHGATADTLADTAALLEVCSATMVAPRVTIGAKVAMGAILGQEGFKTLWAARRNRQVYQATGHRLELPSSQAGKEAMAEKLTAATAAVATNDVENPLARQSLTAIALVFAGTGVVRGEYARQRYEPLVRDILEEQIGLDSERHFDIFQPAADGSL